jgi:hypothetical protein
MPRRAANGSFELASALLLAWLMADTTLRDELEQLIRSHLQRHPAFAGALRRAVGYFEEQKAGTYKPDSTLQNFQAVFRRLTH